MDHSIDELDSCIFDYLVSKTNESKSVYQIFNDITSDTGHRCSELNNYSKREINKKKFMTTCYTMENIFQNIHKIFKDGSLYLVHSKKSKYDIIKEFDNNYENYLVKGLPEDQKFDSGQMIDYILENPENYKDIDMLSHIDYNINIPQYIVKYGKLNQLRKLLKYYEVEVNCKGSLGKNLLDIAIENNHSEIVKELSDYTYSKQIVELMTDNNNLKSFNTKFLKEKNDLHLKISQLSFNYNNLYKKFLFVNFFYFISIACYIWFRNL